MGLLRGRWKDRRGRPSPSPAAGESDDGLRDARAANLQAQEVLEEVRARGPEVSRVSELHRQLGIRNHFAEMLELAMHKREGRA